jgi:2-polyprenyl-3-methyl-5-hydroxy-6-metoxy-1,4-benzoquinol methylase
VHSTNMTPITRQQKFWNEWNAKNREYNTHDVSIDQARIVCEWLDRLGQHDLTILEVGCGSGWFCPRLAKYGQVTGTDLSNEVLARAQQRSPEIAFVPGDFMELDFGQDSYDVLVTLEVLSHVADQPAFIKKLSSHLRPGGLLMLATQNRYELERYSKVPAQMPGQLRHWVNKRELQQLLNQEFETLQIFTINPKADRGFLRLVNSWKLNRLIGMLFGDRFERLKEKMGLGWTIMALARKLA